MFLYYKGHVPTYFYYDNKLIFDKKELGLKRVGEFYFGEMISDDQKKHLTCLMIYHYLSLAAIFIDGDHTHEGVKRDLKNWWPKVKNGGIFSGHDYIWGGQGVKPIVDAFSVFVAKQFFKGDVWYYTK